MPETATIIIERRTAPFRDRYRRYKVLLDNQLVGCLRWGESRSFDVLPGLHTLRLRIDWSGSPERHPHLAPGETATFVCRPSGYGLLALFTRGGALELERVEATD